MKLTYKKLLGEIKPSLEALANVEYKHTTPVAHLLNIAENIAVIELKEKAYTATKTKILDSLVEKDDSGNPKVTFLAGRSEYVLTDENLKKWESRFAELQSQEIEINLHKIEKAHLEGIKIKPIDLKGCLDLLK